MARSPNPSRGERFEVTLSAQSTHAQRFRHWLRPFFHRPTKSHRHRPQNPRPSGSMTELSRWSPSVEKAFSSTLNVSISSFNSTLNVSVSSMRSHLSVINSLRSALITSTIPSSLSLSSVKHPYHRMFDLGHACSPVPRPLFDACVAL